MVPYPLGTFKRRTSLVDRTRVRLGLPPGLSLSDLKKLKKKVQMVNQFSKKEVFPVLYFPSFFNLPKKGLKKEDLCITCKEGEIPLYSLPMRYKGWGVCSNSWSR